MWRGYRGRKSGPFSALEAKSRVVVIAVIWRVKEGCFGRILFGEVFLCEGGGGQSWAQNSKFIFLRQHKHRRLDIGGSGGYLAGAFFKIRAHSDWIVMSMGREVGTCIALTALQGLVSRRNWTMLLGLTSSRYPELARTKLEKNAQKKLVSLSLSLSRGKVNVRGV